MSEELNRDDDKEISINFQNTADDRNVARSEQQVPSYFSSWFENQAVKYQAQQEQMMQNIMMKAEETIMGLVLRMKGTPPASAIQRARDSIPAEGLNTILKNDSYAQVKDPAAENSTSKMPAKDSSSNVPENSKKLAGNDPRRQSASFMPFVASFGNDSKKQPVNSKPVISSKVDSQQAMDNRKLTAEEAAEFNKFKSNAISQQENNKSPASSEDFFCYDAIHAPEARSAEDEEDRSDDFHIDSFSKIRDFRRHSFTSNEARKQKRISNAATVQQQTSYNNVPNMNNARNNNPAMSMQGINSGNNNNNSNNNSNNNNYGGGGPNSGYFHNPPITPPTPGGGSGPYGPTAPPPFPSTPFPNNNNSVVSSIGLAPIMYCATPPSVQHIWLASLSLSAILKFMDDVDEYIIAHRIQIPVATRIATSVRDQLCSQYHGLNINMFYSLSKEQVFHILRYECKPRTVLSFILNLQKYVKFELTDKSYVPGPTNFKPFYDALLKYNALFKRYFTIMSEDNAENIPALNAKENGLVKVYIDKIPYEYGQRVWKSFKKNDSFNSWHEFESRFFDVVRDHFEKYEMSRSVSEHFSRASSVSSNNSKPSYSSSNSYSNNDKKKKYSSNSNVRFSSLHNIHEADIEVDDNDESNQFIDPTNAADEEYSVEEDNQTDGYITAPDDPQYQTAEEPPDPEDQIVADDDDDLNERLHAMMTNSSNRSNYNNNKIIAKPNHNKPAANNHNASHSSKPPAAAPKPNGCISMILYNGKCNKGSKCTFSHDTQVLQKTCLLFCDSKYNPKNRPPIGSRSIVNHMVSETSQSA